MSKLKRDILSLLLFWLFLFGMVTYFYRVNTAKAQIGKEPLSEFKPEIEFSKWDNEAWMRVEYISPEPLTTISLENNKIIWKGDKLEVAYYRLPFSDQYDEGYEYEIILKEKPSTNIFTFKIDTQNLVFYYQPALNKEVWPKGYSVNETHAFDEKGILRAYRPQNIVDSYAVYHSSKRDNEYKIGKAFHIYRPEAIDSKGNRVWCDLNIDTKLGRLSIKVPYLFLNSLNYPIIIDPIFGKTDIGGTESSTANMIACKFNLGENGDITNITAYTARTAGEYPTKAFIYDDNSGVPNDLDGTTQESNITTTPAWYNFTFSSPISEVSANYWLGWQCQYTFKFWYDVGSTNQTDYQAHEWNGFPNPWGVTHNYLDRVLSIYATYARAPPPPENAFDLRVINTTGRGINEVSVKLKNVTINFFDVDTNFTGYVAQQNFTAGNYTLIITKDGYLTYEHDYELTENINWVIKLFTVEEGVLIQNIFFENPIILLVFAVWIFLISLGYYKENKIFLGISAIVGFILMLLVLAESFLLALTIMGISIYFMYVALFD